MLAVIFRVSETRYAIRCQRIIKVIPLVRLEPVPHAPPWLFGTFVYRGALTPVIDLCQLIGGYSCPKRLSSRIILSDFALPNSGGFGTGLLGEHVTEARHLEATPLSGGAPSSAPYLGDAVLEGGSVLRVLDVERLLSSIAEDFSHRRLMPSEADRESTEP